MDSELRARVRATWAAGDYATVGDLFAGAGDTVVSRLGTAGARVLDVGCGTGNTAIRAARAGATSVTGLDLTPELLAVAEQRAGAAGVSVSWFEGDAEQLPFPDASFDRVVSTFGVMFAPDHRRAARELVRVCAPGGTIAVTAWADHSAFTRGTAGAQALLPVPPPTSPSPQEWGHDDHLALLFADQPVRRVTTDEVVELHVPSVEACVDVMTTRCGPILGMRSALEPGGRWPEAVAQLSAALAEVARPAPAGDGVVIPMAYRLTVLERL